MIIAVYYVCTYMLQVIRWPTSPVPQNIAIMLAISRALLSTASLRALDFFSGAPMDPFVEHNFHKICEFMKYNHEHTYYKLR